MPDYTIDTTNERFADPSDGSSLTKKPKIFFDNLATWNIDLKINDGEGTLSNDTSFAGYTAFTIAVDNDFIHVYQGILSGGLSGAITEVTITNIDVPPLKTGELILENAAEERETIAYTSYVANGGGSYTFTVSVTLTYVYLNGDDADVKEELIIKVDNGNIDSSGKATGEFIATIDSDTRGFILATLNSSQIVEPIFEFKAYGSTGRIERTIQLSIDCLNLVDYDSADPPANPTSNYYTKTEMDIITAANTLDVQTITSTQALVLTSKDTTIIVSGTTTLTLPIPGASDVRRVKFLHIDANTFTLNPNGKTINGASGNQTIKTQWAGTEINWDETNWLNPSPSTF